MENNTLCKKSIKKTEKNRNNQRPKKRVNGRQKNTLSDLKHPVTVRLKHVTTRSKSDTKAELHSSFLRDPQSYQNFPDIPTYEPTADEFRQPMVLIKKLKDLGYEKFGCVKVRAPAEWNPEFSLNLQDKKITTRKQVLQDLTKGKSFKQNVKSYTLGEYENFANNFCDNYQRKTSPELSDVYRANEYEYWSLVNDPQFAEGATTVEYAADLPSMRYGSAFPTLHRNKATDVTNVDDERTHPFNLNNLIHAKDSLFQIITRKFENISGITSPWVYAGMMFASFCWHVEDLYMYSINYMHKGAAKTWYFVPESHKEDFERVIKEKYCELFIFHPELLYNIILTMNPLELVKRNIPVYRTEQHPRDFIITFPRVYHAGFSHGYNIGEAVNIATPDWIPYAKLAMKDYASESFLKKGSFPYEWLIVENMKKMNDFNYSEEAREEIAKAYRDIMEKELKDRETVKKCYSKVPIKNFSDLTSRYDANTCNICKNYTYLSFLSCMVCNKKSCTSHVTVCDCLNSTVFLNLRFTEKDLLNFANNAQKSYQKKISDDKD